MLVVAVVVCCECWGGVLHFRTDGKLSIGMNRPAKKRFTTMYMGKTALATSRFGETAAKKYAQLIPIRALM